MDMEFSSKGGHFGYDRNAPLLKPGLCAIQQGETPGGLAGFILL
jgi:hypothetical protein